MRRALALLSILLGMVGPARAVPLAVSESGDFSNSDSSPTAVGVLDLGVNTVAGSAIWDVFADRDYFTGQ